MTKSKPPSSEPRAEGHRYEVGITGRPGEGRLYLDFSLKPVLDAAGAVQYIIAEGRDITAKKHAEALLERKTVELRALYDELQRLDRLKNQFFANVSHELRTPLALIMGLTERLRMGTENAAKARTGEQIAGHARALLAQVNGLRDFAKLDEGEVTLEYSRTDLAALVRRVASSFETVAADRGLTLAVNTPERLDVVVDALKVERILVNLMDTWCSKQAAATHPASRFGGDRAKRLDTLAQ